MTTSNNRVHSHLDEIEWIGKIADLKEEHYRQTLVLSALIELLADKGILSVAELAAKAQGLEVIDTPAEPTIARAQPDLDSLEIPPAAAEA
ncbi:hypothetical protein [Paenibacillus mucilaginosus]|uniref:Uncharacterized protein n=2 Tax=Paenibacillus mucilaginosus TaxID=61624 RepID=H6NIW8_9BACL|nr:hypothetical protein [Paenibacillus mucilaginosus]AEI46422.1 hypothetical protein KNP414_07937 [Paenibacillus mucilaginosus KNP414]AFC34018.1 hypothetical protein PM3016_7452 [Paenibacillus mucilaginosus 3016]MCG7213471.1 hypothetical protein [Paenibacillus mucilaginosus]WDM27710.1 hypothetical protein KCX80_36150 [Paenibacillus mucilaginosus]WFA22383.1 hypothetical protein ERY13_37050 [Paenibacillus mucilaginosus]